MAVKDEFLCHQGIIVKADTQKITVKILSQSACSSCQVKGACNLSDMQEKFIEVPTTGNQLHKPGETVTVAMRESLGTKAVLLVYIVPFVIVLLSLFLFATITGSELQAGLISLLLLIPYYSIIYALRKRLEKTFIFEIKD